MFQKKFFLNIKSFYIALFLYDGISDAARSPTAIAKIPTTIVKKIYIYSKATDSNGLAQPKYSPKQRGYLYNGWGKTSLLKSC